MILRAPIGKLVPLLSAAFLACSDADRRVDTGPPGEVATAVRTDPRPAGGASSARTDPGPQSVGGIAAVRTDVHGVVADLLTADRENGRLTVAVRFRNHSEAPRRIEVADDYGERWRLVAGGRDWPLMREPDGDPAATDPPRRTLKPAQTALWRGTFVAPPAGVTTFRLEIPGVQTFEEVPIADVE